MFIAGRNADDPWDPYIIAEIGVNHAGSMALAKQMIDEAYRAGAHAAKFQSYKAGKLASKDSPAYWDTSKETIKSQYELFQKYDVFDEKDYRVLADHCKATGLDFMSTPFDLEAVEFLEPLVPAFKIASADITHVPLLRSVARSGKPIILSTGASSLDEIQSAVDIVRQAGAKEVALLHCVLNYPTPLEHAQLGMIRTLAQRFPDCTIGYSDHVVPDATLSALECAMLLGASILEKHFTYDKSLPGNDHYHAMDKTDLTRFVAKAKLYKSLYRSESKDLAFEEAARIHARRSIVAARNIKQGEKLITENLTVKRPAHGISPIHWDSVLGRRANRDIENDEILQWTDID